MGRHVNAGRRPDFLLIGTMKSGSTTLFRWLGRHPGVGLPEVKEPGFFSDDRHWARGPDWYASLFGDVGEGLKTGEASVAYTDPERAPISSRRARQVVPGARLVCLLRHPVERMRSHYRHQVQRGREDRAIASAVADADSEYVRRSLYASALEPWLDAFPADQLCVVRYEDMYAGSAEAWDRVLRHLGLPSEPLPTGRCNTTDAKPRYTPVMRRLYDHGLHELARYAPRPVRTLGRRLLMRDDHLYRDLLASSRESLPADVVDAVLRDAARLVRLVGDDALRWDDEHAADLTSAEHPG